MTDGHRTQRPRTALLLTLLLAACDSNTTADSGVADVTDVTDVTDVMDATPDVMDATPDVMDATPDVMDATAMDLGVDREPVDAPPVDHQEPAAGEPGGLCPDAGQCPMNTQCAGARCAFCGGLGELPCAGATPCRVGEPRNGVCFNTATPGTPGGFCRLEDCTPGTCTVPDGRNFVCFVCGEAAGQPCCPIVGCPVAGLRCNDGVCH